MLMRPGSLGRWAFIAALGAWYLGVLLLAFQPRVDDIYRTLYLDGALCRLDKRVRDWTPDARLRYRLGTMLDFVETRIEPAEGEWRFDGLAGTWMVTSRATLLLMPQPVPTGAIDLVVRAAAYVPPLIAETVVVASVNGIELARWGFRRGEGLRDLRAPLPSLARGVAERLGDRYSIAFEVLDPRTGNRKGYERIRVILGLRLAALCLVASGQSCR